MCPIQIQSNFGWPHEHRQCVAQPAGSKDFNLIFVRPAEN